MASKEKIKQIKGLISNNEQIPLSLIENDFSFLKELNDEELDKFVELIPDDIVEIIDGINTNFDGIETSVAMIVFKKSIDIIRKIELTEDEEIKEEYEELLECSKDIGHLLFGAESENDEGYIEYVNGIANYEITDLDAKELKQLIDYKLIDKRALYSMLSAELQDKYFEKFIIDNNAEFLTLWHNTKKQDLTKFSMILKKDKNICYNLLFNTNMENVELVKAVFKETFQHKDDTMFQLWLKARQTNPDIYIPESFLDEKFSFLNIEQIIRFSMADMKTKKKIVGLSKTNYGKEIIEYLCENTEDYINAIGKFVNNMSQYEDLLNDEEFLKRLQNEDEKGYIISKLSTIVIGNNENYFAIESMEDLDYYDESRKYEVNRILKKFNQTDAVVSVEDGQFALLEGLYGIDRIEAEKLVAKYGKYIEDIEAEEKTDKDDIKNYIIALRNILCLKKSDISFLARDVDFMNMINEEGDYNIGTITDIEKKLRAMYSEEFQKKLLKFGDEEKAVAKISYNGKEIKVYEIPRKNENGEYEEIDFGLLARVEGAYGSYERPENYQDLFNNIEIDYHGNCESYINQSMNSIARTDEDGLIFFYTESNDLLMASPWDIGSVEANGKFNTANADEYDLVHPICFTTPDRMADTTRHLHDELVSERYSFDDKDKKVKRRTPNLIGIEKETNDLDIILKLEKGEFYEHLKAASDLDIPILIINREALAVQEMNRIKTDLLLLKKYDSGEIKTDKSFEDIMNNIITRFENNAVGVQFHESKQKLFNNETRKKIINTIINVIRDGSGFEMEKRYNSLRLILQNEVEKQYTNPKDYDGTEEFDGYIPDDAYGNTRVKVVRDNENFKELKELEGKIPGVKRKKVRKNYLSETKKSTLKLKQIARYRKEMELLELQHEAEELDEVMSRAKLVHEKNAEKLNEQDVPNL